jgi:hypothetical protein
MGYGDSRLLPNDFREMVYKVVFPVGRITQGYVVALDL